MGYQSKRRKRRRKRRRHEEELVPSHIRQKNEVDEVQNALKNPALMKQPETIMAMQSVLGNKAVQRLMNQNAAVIQRAEGEETKKQEGKGEDTTQKNTKQEDQQVEQRDNGQEQADATKVQEMNERVENYTKAKIRLEEVFPKADLIPMLETFSEMGYMPDQTGFLVEILNGKHPEYFPSHPESVYSLSEEDAEMTKRPYFFSDDVREMMVKLEIIMSMFFPKDIIMQKIMENPVVSVTGMDGRLLGVTGLGNSAALSDQLNVKAHINEYAPIARILPLDKARKLAELDVELFKSLLGDVLPDHEIDDILKALENFIKRLRLMVARDELMRDPEWNEAKRRGMLDKDSSSFDQIIVALNALPR